MNKQQGNMYPFVTHTWNPIRGKCPHDCLYCYMKVYPQRELRLEEKALGEKLGNGNFIFVGSSTDMWADAVPDEWIDRNLEVCRLYPQNRYLIQTKNPKRFDHWSADFPPSTLLACTIESNRCWNGSKAPDPVLRYYVMKDLSGRKMVSVEPIMDFDLDEFTDMIRDIRPEMVSIGADSKNHHLPEPSEDKVKALITELEKFTKVIQKDNLSRILNKAA